MKIFLIIFITLFFSACSSYQNKVLDIHKQVNISNIKKINTSNSCTLDAYISNVNDVKYGDLFIEYINLDSGCEWKGFQRSYFESLFRDSLKIESMKVVERFDYKPYEFTTYLINDKYYLNLIYKFTAYTDTFIFDYDGILSDELIKKYNKDYVNTYLQEERFNTEYSNSLVRKNFFNRYFIREIKFLNK